jgi:hypothetical protein
MDWQLVEVGAGARTGGQEAVQDFLRFAQLDSAVAGRARLVGEQSVDGAMGAVAVGAKIVGVMARAIASVVVAWLGSYHSDVTIRLTAENGRSIEVVGGRLRRMSIDELGPAVAQIAAVLDGGSAGGADYLRGVVEETQAGEIEAAQEVRAAESRTGAEASIAAPAELSGSAGSRAMAE